MSPSVKLKILELALAAACVLIFGRKAYRGLWRKEVDGWFCAIGVCREKRNYGRDAFSVGVLALCVVILIAVLLIAFGRSGNGG